MNKLSQSFEDSIFANAPTRYALSGVAGLASHPPKAASPSSTLPLPLNPEDLTTLALPSVFQESVAKKVLTSIPVRKPGKEAFVRTHPSPGNWMPFGLLELKEAGKIYLLTPEIAATLRDRGEATFVMANLVLTVDRRQNPLLWPLRIPAREDNWANSARMAAELAKTKWVRVTANMSSGCFDAHVARNQDAEPIWPEITYGEILRLAFADRIVASLDHPVVLELDGD